MKTQAMGWLVVGVLAAGLNASYHNGGMEWAHQVADHVEHTSDAVLALAAGRADRFLTEARLATARPEAPACPLSSALARAQATVERAQDLMSARQEARLARLEAKRERFEAQVDQVRVSAADFNPVVFQSVRMPEIHVPAIHVAEIRVPEITVPEVNVPEFNFRAVNVRSECP